MSGIRLRMADAIFEGAGPKEMQKGGRGVWTLLALWLFLALPTPLWAEVCDKERPDWRPSAGPMSALDELLRFLTLPVGLLLLTLLVLAALLPRMWTVALLLGYAALLLILVALPLLDSEPGFAAIYSAARAEGCIGPKWPIYGLLALVCFAALVYLTRENRQYLGSRR